MSERAGLLEWPWEAGSGDRAALCAAAKDLSSNVRQGFFEWQDFTTVRDKLPEYLKPAMTFAYFTGWRGRSEVLALRWSNIDLRLVRSGSSRAAPKTRTDGSFTCSRN